MWQKKLIDDFYLVIGQPDGSEGLSHVVVDQDKDGEPSEGIGIGEREPR